MACTFPLWRIPFDKCCSYLPNRYEQRVNKGGIVINRDEYEYLIWKMPILENFIQQIGCGKCISCRLKYSREWANRCVLESRMHMDNAFLTLTYSDEYLDFRPYVDVDTGEIMSRPMLIKKDLQDFMKRLRINYEREYGHTGVRFYACGEYGDMNLRPHFHVLLFNSYFDDKKLWFTRNNFNYYTSEFISNTWNKGIVCVNDLSWDTCAYTARYCMKKQTGEKKRTREEFLKHLTPESQKIIKGLWQDEFVLMSRRPGIGREYFDKHKDEIYEYDELCIPKKDGLEVVKPSSYYDRLYDIENPEKMQSIKNDRIKCAKMSNEIRMQNTDLTEEQYLIKQDERKRKQAERLVRPL